MSSSEDTDIEEVAEKIHRVHIERHRIHEKEQKLLQTLVHIRS